MIRSILVLFAALSASACAMAETLAETTGSFLTEAGQAAWTQESLGPQIRSLTLMSASSTTSTEGGSITVGMLMTEPGKIAVMESKTGRMLQIHEAPDTGGGWGSCTGADGCVYMATFSKGQLYRYSPKTGTAESLGRATPETTFIWTVAPAPDGKIYLGCYPKSRLAVYDPKENKITDLGTLAEGEDYIRSLAYDPARKKLYAGIGSHAQLIEYDPATAAKRNVLPEKYRDNHFTYTVAVAGKYLLAKMEPLENVLVFSTDTWEVVNTLPSMSSNGISPVEPNGSSVYYTSGGKLLGYDTATNTVTSPSLSGKLDGRGFTWLTEPDGGHTLRVTGLDGSTLFYNPKTGKGDKLVSQIPQQPMYLQNIIAGPDGKIYTSGYVIGLLGILDPQTRETKQISGVKQAEGVTAYQSQLYFGTYPGANISVFDTALPVSKTNPRTLFSLKEDEQDRPFGMLGVPEEKKVFTGTVPAYGLLGGVLSVYDVETDKHKVFRDVVPKQSLISFAYKNGLLYCGTTISGGLGIEPTEKEPKLFIWDIKQEKKIFECSPVPDRKGISGLQFAPDGNLWGWAQGTLFIFDPVERKVIFNEEKISYTGEFRHFWRGGYMTNGNDGNFYGTLFGNVYKLNQATREFAILAKGGDLELICRDAEGRLYFVKRDQLYRLVPKKQ